MSSSDTTVLLRINEKLSNLSTLRDQFAMAALTGLIARDSCLEVSTLALWSYELADAMLKEREEKKV